MYMEIVIFFYKVQISSLKLWGGKMQEKENEDEKEYFSWFYMCPNSESMV